MTRQVAIYPEALGRGKRQRQILAVPELVEEEGIKASDIAHAIEYDQANVWSTLQALRRAGASSP